MTGIENKNAISLPIAQSDVTNLVTDLGNKLGGDDNLTIEGGTHTVKQWLTVF